MSITFGDPAVPYFVDEPGAAAISDLAVIAEKSDAIDRQKHLFLNETLSDVTFVLENKNRVPAHSLVLSVASEPFAAMFSSGWKRGSEVAISDCKTSAFISLLRFIYGNQILVQKEHVRDLLDVADRFLVSSLIWSMVSRLDAQRIWVLYQFTFEHKYTILQEKCFNFVVAHTANCIDQESFLQISADLMAHLMDSERLAVTEFRLYQRCEEWSKLECERQSLQANPVTQRQVMLPFLHLIRFPTMSLDEFDEGPGKSGILTHGEEKKVLRFFLRGESTDVPFSCQPRNRSNVARHANEQGSCLNVVSTAYTAQDRQYRPTCYRSLSRKRKYHHVYECDKCKILMCAVCARDCHSGDDHQVRYKCFDDSWCCCLINKCDFVKSGEFLKFAEV